MYAILNIPCTHVFAVRDTKAPQTITRRTDNAMPRREATLTPWRWASLARALFGWRSLAGYESYAARIQALGSHDYDLLVIAAAEANETQRALIVSVR